MAEVNEDRGTRAGSSAQITAEDLIRIGPGSLCGQYFRRFWHPVLLTRSLEPGQAKPMRILGEDFTLYRGISGDFHAVAFRCAHRGTQLSTGSVEDECIRCFYHGWKYGPDGQCIERPDEEPRLTARIKIRRYPAREYIGLVFVYFGEDEPPVLPHFAQFEASQDSSGAVDSVIRTSSYTWPCSYLNSMENDSYHGNWVHRDAYAAIGRLTDKQEIDVEETEYGMVAHIARGGTTRFRQTDRHYIMPNCNLRRGSVAGGSSGLWSEAINWRVPVDDESFTTCIVDKIYGPPEALRSYETDREQRIATMKGLPSAPEIAEEILAGRARYADFPSRMEGVSDPRLFSIADYVTQVGQGTFAIMNDEHLGRIDIEVVMLRHLYRRELSALKEGRALKEWVVPEHLASRVSED